ncbi:hypothetical protein V1294_000401 [Bradyrhizobium sp. AZCC 1678]|uniref:Uncharacterized protein n=1 Tax=Bradyrhizobium algeriense TaxID=634784 RepID=A0ABU8BL30_9BRAD
MTSQVIILSLAVSGIALSSAVTCRPYSSHFAGMQKT